MKVYFVEAHSTEKIQPILSKLLRQIKDFKRIGIFSTIQNVHNLPILEKFLKSEGKQVKIGPRGPHCAYPGQVLGCDPHSPLSLKDVDAYVFLGNGYFHPLAVATETDKPVFIANPHDKTIIEVPAIDIQRFRNKRAASIYKFKSAKTIGILATVKPGQNRLSIALQLRKKLEKQGKTAFVFLGETISPEQMQNFSEIDAWVNTCCPRMVEDVEAFGKPIINWNDL